MNTEAATREQYLRSAGQTSLHACPTALADAVNRRAAQLVGSLRAPALRSPACLAIPGTRAGWLPPSRSARLHLPACPSLHAHYRRFTATTDALTPALPATPSLSRAGLPVLRALPSHHSVSNHPTLPCCRFCMLLSSAGLLSVEASPFTRRLAGYAWPNRVRHSTDWRFAFGCSPPHLAMAQLRLATGRELTA